ncbi:signal peptidase II [Devosia sp.]|uniref:signal peptidase II n=1 Tax=Devosia sp. TaxID=1871048 RepID=UPI0032645F16
MNLKTLPSIYYSLVAGVLAFGIDRAQKGYHIAAECLTPGVSTCAAQYSYVPVTMTNWRGGEIVRVTDFFDYVLTWNTGISYGLFDSLPVWALGAVIILAILALSFWWVRADSALIRIGLALCIGGALSNALDRWLYGAVADFFYFHIGDRGFYIFNLADAAITLGVILLILDLLGLGRPRKASVSAS